MSDFEKMIHNMFDHIWDCDINHPVFEDTVGDLMNAVIQCYKNLPSIQPDIDEFLRNKSPKEHREILHWIALRYYPRDSKEVLQAVSNMIRPNTNGGSDDSD